MIYRSPTKDFGDDMTPTAECLRLSLPPRKGGDDMTPTAECLRMSLPPRKGRDDMTPTAECLRMSLPLRKGGDDKILKTRHFMSDRPLTSSMVFPIANKEIARNAVFGL